MDYLPIQPSAVPCERVFSSSADTDVKKRNRIHPTLMEALQMTKFSLKKNRANLVRRSMISEEELACNEDTEDVLAVLASMARADSNKAMAHAINMLASDKGDQ